MRVIDLLASQKQWTRERYARDIHGLSEHPLLDTAVGWCLIGAVRKCYGYKEEANIAMSKLARTIIELGYREDGAIACFNDASETTFEDIRKVIEKADI